MVVVVAALGWALSVVGQADPSPHAWVVIDDPVQFAPRDRLNDSLDGEAEPDEARDANAESEQEPGPGIGPTAPASVLLHIPPRVPIAGASPAPDLRVARVARLAAAPEWLIPVGSSVYAIMPADEQGIHRVGRSRAYPRGLRDLWGSDPARRLEVLPALAGTVLAVASDGSAPVVATQTGAGVQLVRFEGVEWSPLGTPLAIELGTDASARIGLVWLDNAPSVVRLVDTRAVWATLTGGGWNESGVALPAGFAADSLRIIGDWNGELVAIADAESRTTGQALSVLSISRRAARVMGRVPAPEAGGVWQAAAIVADPGRLVVVCTGTDATEDAQTALPSPGLKQRPVTMAEFSLVTGSMLAMGEATASSPVSRGEVQSLAILLVASMILVLVVVVRPTPAATEPVLPPGTAIASNGRRLASSLADLVPSVVVTSSMLDISVLETLGPLALPITGSVDLMPLLMVLSITSMHCALGEMLTGRSLGKMLTGIFVARVDAVPGATPDAGRFRPPTPAGAMLRNIMKWFLFPATALVLSDPSGRHRGDLVARSAVLMPIVDQS